MQYSKELVKRYQHYMAESRDQVVSDEQAQLDLHSLGALFGTFVEIENDKARNK